MVALFGRYEYLHELGRGASGRVFAVRDLADQNAPRAIKVLSGSSGARLSWEFARLSRIEHERVARVRELLRVEAAEHAPFQLAAGALLLVEDLAPGRPLAQLPLLDASALERERFAVRVALGAAAGLSAIHGAGLVHGDIKPENLMVEEAEQCTTLIDLGLCEPPGFREQPHGTPRYMAPELLSGWSSAAADVYALGATLFDWLVGDAPEHLSTRGEGLRIARSLESLSGVVSRALCELLGRFLSPDPAHRPAGGHEAYLALGPIAQALGIVSRSAAAQLPAALEGSARAARARSLPYVGQTQAVAALKQHLAQYDVVLVAGARGAGRSRLVREALRQLTLERADAALPLPTIVRSIDALAGLREISAVLWLEPTEAEAERTLATALRLKAVSARALGVVIECGPLFRPAGVARVDLGPLGPSDQQALLRALFAPDVFREPVSRAAIGAAQGLAGRLCEVVASALALRRDLADPRSFTPAFEEAPLMLSPPARRLGELFAWAGVGLKPEHCRAALGSQAQLEEALAELWARGLLAALEDRVQLAPHVARALRGASRVRAKAIVAELPSDAFQPTGFTWFACAEHERAERAFVHSAQELRSSGQVDAAVDLLREAFALLPSEALRWWLGDSVRAQASYAAALEVLEPSTAPAAQLLFSEVLRLAGDRARASELAERLCAQGEGVPQDVRDRALALRSRLRFDAGELEVALSSAEALLEKASGELRVRALEVKLLVGLSTGLPAKHAGDALVESASLVSSGRWLARALSLRAQLLARHGDSGPALRDLTRALELAKRAGEAHETATYALNLGLLQMDAGDLGVALESLHHAAFALSRIDRPRDLARVLYNLAALSMCVGDDARAQALVSAATGFLGHGDAAASAFLQMLGAELALRQGQLDTSARLLERALAELPVELSPVRGLLASRAALAQLSCGQEAKAEAWLAIAREHSSESDVVAFLELSVAQIRIQLAQGSAKAAEEVATRAMGRLSQQTPFPERLRFLLAAIDAARAADLESAARERTLLCRALLEAALASLSPSDRALLRGRPEYARVLAAAPIPRASSVALGNDRWRRLVRASRRLFGAGRRVRIAEELAELALDLVHAERALVVAATDAGELQVRAQAELVGDRGRAPLFSRSVVERVWSEGKALVTIEASRDLRLHAAQSIHALSVRSVLALPLEGFGEPAVLYLDDRLRAEAFTAEDLELMEDLAALTREALRAAEARSRDRRRARKAEEEVHALSAALAEGAPQAPNAVPLVGSSPALTRVIESARRVAKSDVSVLVTGESGTGKELLARLVHEHSGRRGEPFVAENCAALPDTLLESALFGHVRGAFTGADRARRGLFEVADKGTLFLDEVGEMSPALQAKLLRVLQEGELRPLGSDRVRRVDVRVIAATRRDLAACVREGTFREDLFYRLAVVTLVLPPLSARREDIPLLVRHFITKHQGKQRASISAAALRALAERDYPGNARQLENEVRRALALCEGGRIELTDLPAEAQVPGAALDGLDLHAQLSALSDKLVAEALRRASGNVTQAAALLGISRFGLQKMLKRGKGGDSSRD